MALDEETLKTKLDAWGKTQTKLSTARKKRDKELDPFVRQHSIAVAPILDKYNEIATPLEAKASQLATEIESLLLANKDGKGLVIPVSISSVKANASVSKSEGSRVIQAQRFFDAVKNKSSEFWACITVQIGKADKLLGKAKVDEMSDKKVSVGVSISLNE